MCAAAAALPFQSTFRAGAVQIIPGLLEAIRDRVLDGYAAAPHGGVEVGFVLLGRNQDNGIVIEQFREIPCAHLLSPRFLLSPEEENNFSEWLKTLSADPQLEGTDLLGWGCSHNRSELALLDREVAFHGRHFSQPDQFVMVVKPQSMQAVLAGIFSPDERGVIDAESPAIQLRSALLDSVLVNESKTMNEDRPKIVQPLEAAVRALGAPRKRRFRISGQWFALAAGSAVLAAFLVLGFTGGLPLPSGDASPNSLSVALHPQADDLVFTWIGKIDRVESATIEVLDGDTTSHFDITKSFQRTGVFVFPHRSGNVQVVLRARTQDGEVVRNVGFADGRKSAGGTDTPTDAAARLDATNRRLAALVSVLQSRWKPREK